MDSLFRDAVSAIDAGDLAALQGLLNAHPELLRERLGSPGHWLRQKVGNALEGYFRQPYLLWFVAENPIRNETLPTNIAQLAGVIIDAAKLENVTSLQEQLDYTLALVVTGRVARACGVQHALIDVLMDAGAVPGNGNGALGARNLEAIEHFISRGTPLTLASALCLERFDDAASLTPGATNDQRQTALVAAALNGKPAAIRKLLALGVDVNARSTAIHKHGTPLHHAVDSGSVEAVTVLVEGGASLDARDRVYDGTPLDWAEYLGRTEIAAYLRNRRPPP